MNKYVKVEVNVYIDDSVDWDVDSYFGAEFCRVVNGGVDSDDDDEVRISDNEGVEL